MQKNEIEPLNHMQKSTQNGLNSNMRPENVKLQEENIEEKLFNVLAMIFAHDINSTVNKWD